MKKLIKLFLVTLVACTMLTGCTQEKQTETTTENETRELVIIGGGGAGLAAAVEAADAGLTKITVIEKMSEIGGTTFISQGMIAGYQTQVQQAEGSVETNYDEMYNNLMNNAKHRLDSFLTSITVKESGNTIDWLIDRVNVPFQEDVLVGYGPLEMMHVVEGYGIGMLEPFKNTLEEAGVEILTNTKGIEIVLDENNAIKAVKCESNGEEFVIDTKAVVIATGGYASNPELTTLLDPEFEGTFGIGHAGATGDGLIMANNVGATLTHTNDLMAVLKDYEIMKYHNGTSASASMAGFPSLPNMIMVGQEGKRFMDESNAGYMSQEWNRPIFNQMNKDQAPYVWIISDQAAVDAKNIVRKGDLEYIKADTIAELAEKLGVDANNLEQTINNYNAYVDSGNDLEFKRSNMTTKLQAPYVAVATVPCEIITYGGIARNEWAEVLRADGSSIDGLYVAGEAAANSAYMGFTISNAFTWGRIAGANAANYVLGNEKTPSQRVEKIEEVTVRFDMTTPLKDGEYTSTVNGQDGPLSVKVTIVDSKISSVEITENNETEAIAANALEQMPLIIVENNSVDVDTISGATLTSNRIMDAVANCLKEASN